MRPDSKTPVPNASITEVAALAGVSIATVSRVLTGQRNKNDGIDRRVRKAAAQLQYSPNIAASALRSNILHTLGIIVSDPSDPFTSRFLTALEASANTIGKQLLIGIGKERETQINRIKSMIVRRVDGIIIIPVSGLRIDPDLESAYRSLPMVQISNPLISDHIDWVGIDESESMQIALDHLSAHNARSIAFLSDIIDSDASADRYMTFQTSMNLRNLITEPSWTTFADGTIQRGYDDTLTIFDARNPRPDAILCENDEVAVGAVLALHTLGLQVPDDICVIGRGDTHMAQSVSPALSSLRPPIQDIVNESLRLVSRESVNAYRMPAHIEFPLQLIERESTATPRFGSSDMALP
jgi:LacI family transcriptional regulator